MLPNFNQKVCPDLGLGDDKETISLCADVANFCHRCSPAKYVIPQQLKTCFSGGLDDCPYCLTRGHRARRWLRHQWHYLRHKRPWALPAALLALIGSTTALALNALSPAATPPQRVNAEAALPPTLSNPLPTPAEPQPLPAALPVSQPSTQPTPASQPTRTSLPPSPGPLAETPFGPGHKLQVHIVTQGESLEIIADQYHTNTAVLLALNPRDGRASLWTGEPIIIAPGLQDPAQALPLYAHWVEKRVKLEELSTQSHVSPQQLREWNGIEGDWIEPNRWVVVTFKPVN